MTARKPAALARIEDPHRTIEIACFLRLTLLRVTDAGLTLLDHQIAALWRGARERAEDARASRLRRLRQLLGDLAGLAGEETLDAAALRSRLRGLIAPFAAEREATQVVAIRQELGRKSTGPGSAAEDGACGGLDRSCRPSARRGLRNPRCHRRIVGHGLAERNVATVRSVVAGADRPAGSGGRTRLLSRGDPDGAEAGGAQPLGLGRSQPVASGPRGPADPAETVAARPRALHPRPQSAGQRGEISPASGSGSDRRAGRIGRSGGGRHGGDRRRPAPAAPPPAGARRIRASRRRARRSRAPPATSSCRTC